MFISTENIVYYLLNKGLVTLKSVVNGDFICIDTSRRNLNIKVIRKHSPGYFIKQIRNIDEQSISDIFREVTCYRLAESDKNFKCLFPLLPKFYKYDPARNILIVELIQGGENFSEYYRRLGSFPVDSTSLLGKILGTYHREPIFDEQITAFPKKIPWILSLNHHGAKIIEKLSSANSHMFQIIQKYPEFPLMLENLRNQWQTDSFIHGDMKWANCIIRQPDNKGNEMCIKIVDWEQADFGDACWDVGAIFQEFISFWIMSIQISGETQAVQLSGLSKYPLKIMQPAIQSFWRSYSETLMLKNDIKRELLERSVKYSAARIIQTVYEELYNSNQINPNIICMLQVSFNILKNPQEAIKYLFNISK